MKIYIIAKGAIRIWAKGIVGFIFSSKEKTISRIFNYFTMRINLLTNQHKTREYDKRLHKVKNNIYWKTSSPDGVTRYIGIYTPDKTKDGYYSVILWKCKMIGID